MKESRLRQVPAPLDLLLADNLAAAGERELFGDYFAVDSAAAQVDLAIGGTPEHAAALDAASGQHRSWNCGCRFRKRGVRKPKGARYMRTRARELSKR